MRRPRTLGAVLSVLATTIASAGLVLGSGAGAQAAATAATPLPAHVFAPYFEAYNGDSPAALSEQSGAKYLTMAFVQTEARGSCTRTGTAIRASPSRSPSSAPTSPPSGRAAAM